MSGNRRQKFLPLPVTVGYDRTTATVNKKAVLSPI